MIRAATLRRVPERLGVRDRQDTASFNSGYCPTEDANRRTKLANSASEELTRTPARSASRVRRPCAVMDNEPSAAPGVSPPGFGANIEADRVAFGDPVRAQKAGSMPLLWIVMDHNRGSRKFRVPSEQFPSRLDHHSAGIVDPDKRLINAAGTPEVIHGLACAEEMPVIVEQQHPPGHHPVI